MRLQLPEATAPRDILMFKQTFTLNPRSIMPGRVVVTGLQGIHLVVGRPRQ